MCANSIFRRANRVELASARRSSHCLLDVEGEVVLIRDQAPLYLGNMKLEAGWDFERFVLELNDHVFFWPGKEDRPISYGIRHFARYEQEDVRILRVPTVDLIETNGDSQPLVCKFNSGSPRWSRGQPSPRGSSTFVTLTHATFPAASVVEVTFRQQVELPTSTVISATPFGPWSEL